ncbi:hypothetical protein LQZ19_13000 [Treponema primitia]|uniref:hypothetical protein n=1 Tax=Treponema primitia TaxID=88058 RepID=UPI00397FB018
MKDPAFAAIEAVIYQIGLDFDYDWNNYSGNPYGRVSYENPNTTKGVCSDFAAETVKRLEGNEYISSIESWSGKSHAWNVFVLKDGRRLYCDTTWYEGNNVKNRKVPYGCQQDPSQLTFDEEEFNSHGFCTVPGGGYLKIHNNWPAANLNSVTTW